MQFLVTGRDSTDDGALDRRLAARADHISVSDELFNQGKLLFGVALVDSTDKMVGSSMVFETESREELDTILAAEPYVVQKVWNTVEVEPCRVGPTFLKLFEQAG